MISGFAAPTEVSPDCGNGNEVRGGCTSATTGSDDVVLHRTDTDDGSTSGSPGTGRGGVATPAEPEHPTVGGPDGVYRDEYTVIGPFTLSDLEDFHPVPGADHSEPGAWSVVGLETNFIASTTQHVVDGELAGESASVRFTPEQWIWNYGDGTTGTASTGGASWDALGVDEFDETPTSHVFRQRGTFTVRPSVVFSAEYRVAEGDWVSVDGTLQIAMAPITLVVARAETALVNEDCNANPNGPGC
jgi:hypothetical protein